MTDQQAKDLGRLITTRRTAAGYSIRDIEHYTRIPVAWLARVESGTYLRPGVDRLFTVAAKLEIDPEEMDQETGGYLSTQLPSTRAYFRAKHGMKHKQIDRIERLVKKLRDPQN
ncbi:MAG: helix-turn-helix domain-containing protein [Solirubrobacterales bacterium]|nr:helix-turn-helix domain-containing protein [Solirubrobacterales bacterium]